jgi:hypothetical protein
MGVAHPSIAINILFDIIAFIITVHVLDVKELCTQYITVQVMWFMN